jgi:amino acid transporter
MPAVDLSETALLAGTMAASAGRQTHATSTITRCFIGCRWFRSCVGGVGGRWAIVFGHGPEEAFRTLGEHTYLAVGLAVLTACTVLVIASAYSRIIEQFPYGGGYFVATRLLGERAGVVSGAAPWWITCSRSPFRWRRLATLCSASSPSCPGMAFRSTSSRCRWNSCHRGAYHVELRGVRESVLALTPIFVIFLLTHAVLIGGGVIAHLTDLPDVARHVGTGFRAD